MRPTLSLAAALSLAAIPIGFAQDFRAATDKTFVIVWRDNDINNYVYVAPSGRVFWHYTPPDIEKHGMSAGGDQFVIGRTIPVDLKETGFRIRGTATASWSKGRLVLKKATQTTLMGPPSIKVKPDNFTVTIDLDGESCSARLNGVASGSCKVVAGNQMPK